MEKEFKYYETLQKTGEDSTDLDLCEKSREFCEQEIRRLANNTIVKILERREKLKREEYKNQEKATDIMVETIERIEQLRDKCLEQTAAYHDKIDDCERSRDLLDLRCEIAQRVIDFSSAMAHLNYTFYKKTSPSEAELLFGVIAGSFRGLKTPGKIFWIIGIVLVVALIIRCVAK
jgi:hypothetical protein